MVSVLILKGMTVIDGTGQLPKSHGILVIRNRHIAYAHCVTRNLTRQEDSCTLSLKHFVGGKVCVSLVFVPETDDSPSLLALKKMLLLFFADRAVY